MLTLSVHHTILSVDGPYNQ